VPIEAMISGTPVIAFGKWWALETVIEWETWIFFEEQSVESLNKAIKKFEKMKFNANEIRKHAEKFDKKVFKKKILKFIEAV
jgi:glycosyltransferase involved in cell wall biosynthesis